jgi:butyrate kinase
MNHKILAINPGSTSTKIAVYHNAKPIFLKSIQHNPDKLAKFTRISDQYEFRKEIVLKELKNSLIDIENIEVIVGRGGLVHPIESGVYHINNRLRHDLLEGVMGEHASNLGGLIAHDIAKDIPNCKAFIADPVVVDELQDVARIAGHPKFQRYSIFHALNQKATARAYARLMNRKYEDLNLVIAHLGGGVSVGAHRKGKVIDVNQALDGEGPFSPERSGTLPAGALAKLCFDGLCTLDEIKRMITGEGGYVAYMGTNSAYEVELLAQDGDDNARLIQDAMSYQIGKEIASMCAVLHGEVDAIILTGGISHNPMVVEYIKKMVSFIAPVVIYPGEDEMHALAMNGLMVLKGEIKPKEYDESTMVNVKLPCWEARDREKDEMMKDNN